MNAVKTQQKKRIFFSRLEKFVPGHAPAAFGARPRQKKFRRLWNTGINTDL
jgi:hypothetical protein